jgi:hypothetical protein
MPDTLLVGVAAAGAAGLLIGRVVQRQNLAEAARHQAIRGRDDVSAGAIAGDRTA